MKKTDELKQLRTLDEAGLRKELRETEEELMKLRFKKAMTQLEKTDQLKTLRAKVARIRTIQNTATA